MHCESLAPCSRYKQSFVTVDNAGFDLPDTWFWLRNAIANTYRNVEVNARKCARSNPRCALPFAFMHRRVDIRNHTSHKFPWNLFERDRKQRERNANNKSLKWRRRDESDKNSKETRGGSLYLARRQDCKEQKVLLYHKNYLSVW